MRDGDFVVLAAPRGSYPSVVHRSLLEALIPARLVDIDSVPPGMRPKWACGEGLHVYVVVPKAQTIAAIEVVSRVWRICQNCDTPLLAEERVLPGMRSAS
jgi:hypothetical protein